MTVELQAILFDMDGVLVDSRDSWHGALNEALQAYGHDPLSMDEFLSTYWGDDLRAILSSLGLPLGIADFCLATYPNHTGAVKLFQETKGVLGMLTAYRKAVVTNTPQSCTSQILSAFGLEDAFDAVVTSDMVPRGKPHPDMLIRASESLGIPLPSCIMVGDTEMDVRAARAAGIPVVGIGIEADMTIGALSELPYALKRWSHQSG